MNRGRVGSATRWLVAAAALVAASALATLWHPGPHPPTVTLTAINLIPPIFTSSLAQGPTTVTGDDGKTCTGTPVSPNGKLAITLKKLQLVNDKGESIPKLPDSPWGPGTLDFAQNSGATVGNFVALQLVPPGTYTKMSVTMGSVLSVKGFVTCTKGGTTTTYITNGASSLTSPDVPGAAANAVESNYTINGGVETPFDLPFSVSVVFEGGQSKTLSVFFNNNAALTLWDISSITGNAGDRKILPGGGGPSKAE